MTAALGNYATNLVRLLRGNRVLRPLVAVYYLTTRCNLNCAYCEDFGQRRNAEAAGPLPLDDALRILRVIRTGTDRLILTGGEPLLHPDAAELAHRARLDQRFRHITLQTNGLLLHEREAVLPAVDRLVVSLDTVDPDLWSEQLGVSRDTTATIVDNVAHYADRQREFGYRMAVNCVLSPATLPTARTLLEWCQAHDLLVSFSPQAVNNWPHYDLLVNDEYRAWVLDLIDRKRHGAPILGSTAYLHTLLDLRLYSCYPALIPRVMPGGELIYPCWPIERAGHSHGGRPCSLLDVSTWDEALARAVDGYGAPPRICTSCFQQCYAEPSLMQARPFSYLAEWLRYPVSRRGAIATYAPG
ncbi:MAG: radical SAM protein [Anaerolineae bacterium]|nr:radical SAM protein [Anaerolineae bacterium]